MARKPIEVPSGDMDQFTNDDGLEAEDAEILRRLVERAREILDELSPEKRLILQARFGIGSTEEPWSRTKKSVRQIERCAQKERTSSKRPRR